MPVDHPAPGAAARAAGPSPAGSRRCTLRPRPNRAAPPVSIGCVSDADLVALARRGDPAAFGELVDRHRMAVYRAALAALGSHADAEDAAQEAFLSAYQRLSGFRGDASFKTWLLTITWHHAINRRRSMTRWWRRVVAPPADGGPEWEPASPDASPEQAIVGNELRRRIEREIRALAPPLRDALLLAQSGEHSYQEIGAMLNAPVGTIKWRVSEARKRIRQRLREHGHGDVV
jgi:RNA polymerase sigma-70 factor, ECF subfamily